MEPLVAKPHSPDNRDTAHNCRDVKLDQAYIGSCTGGKITDMIFAANILKGNQVKIPTYVVPGSTEVHADMKRLNLRGRRERHNEKSIEDVLADAGCLIGASGCAACLGGPTDTFGRLEEALSLHQHHQPEFPWTHGLNQVLGISRLASDGGRISIDRPCYRSPRLRDKAHRNRLGRGYLIVAAGKILAANATAPGGTSAVTVEAFAAAVRSLLISTIRFDLSPSTDKNVAVFAGARQFAKTPGGFGLI